MILTVWQLGKVEVSRQRFTLNPPRRLGHAHAVLGCEHARNGGISTPTSVGARLTPQSPVAWPNHRASTLEWETLHAKHIR